MVGLMDQYQIKSIATPYSAVNRAIDQPSTQPSQQHPPSHRHPPAKQCQIIRVQRNIPLKTPILMMQMVRATDTILLRPGQTELTPSAHAAREPDTHQSADFQLRLGWVGVAVGS